MKNSQLAIKISFRSLLKFILPTVIMYVFMALYTLVDGIFVAQFINSDAFAAINIVFPLVSFVIALATMFGSGATAIISKKIGEKNDEFAREVLTFVFIFSILVIIVLCSFMLGFLDPFLRFLGASERLFPYSYEYALYLIPFLPFSILQLQFLFYFTANGKAHLGLIAIVLGGFANLLLDWIFMDILSMGIKGAAIGTGISCLIPTIFGIIYFTFFKKNKLFFVKLKMRWKELWMTIFNGSSEMINNLSISVTTFLFNVVMLQLIGEDGVAAITIILYLDFLFVSISLGYSLGVGPLVSYNFGSKDIHKIKKLYFSSLIFSFTLGILTTIFVIIFSKQIVSIFVPQNSSVFLLAIEGIVIFAICYIFKCFNVFTSSFFTAFNNGLISGIISGMRSLLFLITAIITSAALFGAKGIWYAVPIAEVLTLFFSTLFLILYRNKYNYSLNLNFFKKNQEIK